MGIFHEDLGELHGITVVVDTVGPRILVGRCHEFGKDGILLLDADVHEEGGEGLSKREWLERASRHGVWKKFDRIAVPKNEIASVRRLGEFG